MYRHNHIGTLYRGLRSFCRSLIGWCIFWASVDYHFPVPLGCSRQVKGVRERVAPATLPLVIRAEEPKLIFGIGHTDRICGKLHAVPYCHLIDGGQSHPSVGIGFVLLVPVLPLPVLELPEPLPDVPVPVDPVLVPVEPEPEPVVLPEPLPVPVVVVVVPAATAMDAVSDFASYVARSVADSLAGAVASRA